MDSTQMNNIVADALNRLGYLEGIKPYGDEVCVVGGTMDAMLLAITMSTMIKYGDLEINLVGNSAGKQDYFYKLLNSRSWESEDKIES